MRVAFALASLLAASAVHATPVSVCRDATYEIPASRGAICSGAGAAPAGRACPLKGDAAIEACHPYLPSFDGKACVAKEDAVCDIVNGNTWGCVFPSVGCVKTPKPAPAPTTLAPKPPLAPVIEFETKCPNWDFVGDDVVIPEVFVLEPEESNPVFADIFKTESTSWYEKEIDPSELYKCNEKPTPKPTTAAPTTTPPPTSPAPTSPAPTTTTPRPTTPSPTTPAPTTTTPSPTTPSPTTPRPTTPAPTTPAPTTPAPTTPAPTTPAPTTPAPTTPTPTTPEPPIPPVPTTTEPCTVPPPITPTTPTPTAPVTTSPAPPVIGRSSPEPTTPEPVNHEPSAPEPTTPQPTTPSPTPPTRPAPTTSAPPAGPATPPPTYGPRPPTAPPPTRGTAPRAGSGEADAVVSMLSSANDTPTNSAPTVGVESLLGVAAVVVVAVGAFVIKRKRDRRRENAATDYAIGDAVLTPA